MTEKIIASVTGVLEKELAKLDTTIGKVSIEKPVDELWDKLQKPISIAKGKLWFRIRPQQVALGPITATDSTLTARLDLQAKPRIRAGERPPDDTVPLPPLGRTQAVIDTADVFMEGTLHYAAANEALAKRVTGKTIGKGWRRVKIENIVAGPAGMGKILLGVTISGAADGTVYVVGTPNYDSVTKLMTVPDLAFDVKSQGYLESPRAGSSMARCWMKFAARQSCRCQELLDQLVQIVNKEINRAAGRGDLPARGAERRPCPERAGGAAGGHRRRHGTWPNLAGDREGGSLAEEAPHQAEAREGPGRGWQEVAASAGQGRGALHAKNGALA